MTSCTPKEIKNRLSNIGEAIGSIALEYIAELEKENAELETQIKQLQKMYDEQKEILKKVRVALIQERTANIMNYGKGGVEMFDNIFDVISKSVSN